MSNITPVAQHTPIEVVNMNQNKTKSYQNTTCNSYSDKLQTHIKKITHEDTDRNTYKRFVIGSPIKTLGQLRPNSKLYF